MSLNKVEENLFLNGPWNENINMPLGMWMKLFQLSQEDSDESGVSIQHEISWTLKHKVTYREISIYKETQHGMSESIISSRERKIWTYFYTEYKGIFLNKDEEGGGCIEHFAR